MAVTPNYGWPVPVATDYVKDGWEAISDLGNAIDTTVAGLPSGGMTLISTTTLTGASVTLSSIPQTYKHLQIIIRNYKPSTGGETLVGRINGDSATRYVYNLGNTNYTNSGVGDGFFYAAAANDPTTAQGLSILDIPDYTNTVTRKMTTTLTMGNVNGASSNFIGSRTWTFYNQTGAITSLVFFASAGNLNGGSLLLYGVN